MKILLYIPKDKISHKKIRLLGERSIENVCLSPTLLNAFGAMKIASSVEKNNIDIVECITTDDAMAAVAARKICKREYAVIVAIRPNTKIPKSIHKDIRRGTDAWIFPSQRLANAYPDDLKNKTVIPTVSFDITEKIPYPGQCDRCTLTWIAPITDPYRLTEVIKAFDRCSGNTKLRICGTGKAAHVMPAVRYARTVSKSSDIEWLAEEYNVKEELSKAHAIIASANDITEIEAAAALNGRPVLTPQEIAEFVANPKPSDISNVLDTNKYIDKITEIYRNIIK